MTRPQPILPIFHFGKSMTDPLKTAMDDFLADVEEKFTDFSLYEALENYFSPRALRRGKEAVEGYFFERVGHVKVHHLIVAHYLI